MDQIVQLRYIIDITGILSLMGIGITLWFNYRENRINRYVQLVTAQTLANNNFIRENSSMFTTLTRPEVINEAILRCDTEYKFKLIHSEANMELQFKYCFEIERTIIEHARALCKLCIQYYDSPTEQLESQIRILGEKYYEVMTIYDYADWLYIKSQARSKAYNKSFANFEEIFSELSDKTFKAKDIPTMW